MYYPSKSLAMAILVTSLTLQACGGGGGSSTPSNNTPPVTTGTTPPVITLSGSETVNHEQGTSYTDAGATASDANDGSVSVTTSGEVGTDAGSYTLTYSASDAAGNTATANRIVIVADTTDPQITLNGDAEVSIEEGSSYSEAGVVATDTVDASVDVETIGTVGTAVGTYTLTYTATDDAVTRHRSPEQ